MPSGTGHHHHHRQLVAAHELHNRQQQASFLEDPCCPSLFSISNPQYSQHPKHFERDMFSQHHHQFSQTQNQFHEEQVVYETQVEEAAGHPFCSLNFKLGLNENSSSSVGGALNQCQGFGNLVLSHGVPEARPNSLDVPNSWQTQQDSQPIKETFWKPLNGCNEDKNGGKCYKSGPGEEEEEERHDNSISLEEKYRLFSELEAIYSLPNVPAAADQAGSTLTGEITSPSSNIAFLTANNTSTAVPAAANAPTGVDRGSEISIGGEEAASLRKKMLKRKRKKKMKEQLGFVVGFFECLVKRVMEHQEGLHRKFLEAIERMDKGRTESEEAWRRQEAEKRNREALNRAHDQALAFSREDMVVQYIEKITGESIDLPARTTTTQLQAADVSKQSSKIVDTNCRWPKAEVEALIGARSRLEPKFQEPGLKGPLWEEVSSAIASMGYQRSAKRCKEKWENINKYFRKKKESANSKGKKKKKSCEPSKTCSYFDQLDQLYSRSDHGLSNDDPCSLPGLDETQRRGGYSELLAYIVAQNTNTSANLNACGMESSKSDGEANLDEKAEGNNRNEEDENNSEGGGGEEEDDQ